MKVKDYAADHIFSFLCLAVSGLLIFALLWLIETPMVFIFFVESIMLTAYLCAFLYDYWRRRNYYTQLWKILDRLEEKTLIGEILVRPDFLDGQILDEILRRCNKYQNDRLADAKQDSQEYREYLDSWVHEIKTPIAAARLIIENHKNTTTLRIDDELRRIDGFVEQVLYYARSAAVEKDFKVEKTTLHALVNSALKTYSKPLIQAGGRPVFCGLDIPVCADTKSCSFIIGQIISNSIKYRTENLQVSFSAYEEQNAVRLLISDNGIGISSADLPRVFDKGFTGDNGRRYSKSTGIGLYLCKKLCGKMNIGITIQSDLGQGTTVILFFPQESYLQEAGL
ncbi:sensor histidine kinase [Parablautia intestinalis]|uniref:histidine kinase n=1 Tax=Parablautia intestinalis TaxID=2320100 RepID=A0A3A9AI50_9FIRM|nr:sensor histidine kinase [Parablautia intestinalis]RKI91029.1 sensor histidine kinase [Parablautia intestinalis]